MSYPSPHLYPALAFIGPIPMIKGTFNVFLYRPTTGSNLMLKYVISHQTQLSLCEVKEERERHIAQCYQGWVIKEFMGIS